MMITTIRDLKLYDVLKSFEWKDDDEISITKINDQIIIKKANNIPNAETIQAIEEMEEAMKNPHLLKKYSSFSEVLEEIENEI